MQETDDKAPPGCVFLNNLEREKSYIVDIIQMSNIYEHYFENAPPENYTIEDFFETFCYGGFTFTETRTFPESKGGQVQILKTDRVKFDVVFLALTRILHHLEGVGPDPSTNEAGRQENALALAKNDFPRLIYETPDSAGAPVWCIVEKSPDAPATPVGYNVFKFMYPDEY